MRELDPKEGLRLFDIKWCTDTAGPSPNNNERIEIFLLGCQKAMQGRPCEGCFNSITWDSNKAEYSWDPIELADMINEGCNPNNKYITIGGGEPTDQIEKLIPFCKRLKEHGFHIMMYTWKNLKSLLEVPSLYFGIPEDEEKQTATYRELLRYLDMIVDGQFISKERMYQQDLGDGMLSSIGSGNQRIIDAKHYRECKEMISYPMRDLVGLYIKPDTNDLVYITKE